METNTHRHYEIMYIVRPLAGEATSSIVDKYSTQITKSGSIHRLEKWGSRPLAYAIRDYRNGFYVLMNVECPPSVVSELEEKLRFDTDVLRFMIFRCAECHHG